MKVRQEPRLPSGSSSPPSQNSSVVQGHPVPSERELGCVELPWCHSHLLHELLPRKWHSGGTEKHPLGLGECQSTCCCLNGIFHGITAGFGVCGAWSLKVPLPPVQKSANKAKHFIHWDLLHSHFLSIPLSCSTFLFSLSLPTDKRKIILLLAAKSLNGTSKWIENTADGNNS